MPVQDDFLPQSLHLPLSPQPVDLGVPVGIRGVVDERLVLSTGGIGGRFRLLELPSGDASLVKLVQLDVRSAVRLQSSARAMPLPEFGLTSG